MAVFFLISCKFLTGIVLFDTIYVYVHPSFQTGMTCKCWGCYPQLLFGAAQEIVFLVRICSHSIGKQRELFFPIQVDLILATFQTMPTTEP